MAFDINRVNGYGTGGLGNVVDPTGQINSYACVTAFDATTVTVTTYSEGAYEKFNIGTEIMLHVSAGNGVSTEAVYNGKYMFCTITNKVAASTGFTLTVDNDFTQVIPAAEISKYQIQAITVANFQSLTLSTKSISPIVYDVTKRFGGVIVIKCSDSIIFNGGSITLNNLGIPTANAAYRPLTVQESNGTNVTDPYACWENSITQDRFLLNSGDGAVALFAKTFTQQSNSSRIGGTNSGAQFQRGNSVVGGPTIFCAFDSMNGFNPSIISKATGNKGIGLGRCYIATNTKLRNDEALYAYDILSNNSRVMNNFNIKSYGDGNLGDMVNQTRPLNNYAKVTGISDDGKTIGYVNKTSNGIVPIQRNSLIMFHVSNYSSQNAIGYLGKFMMARVIADDGNNLILDNGVTKVFNVTELSHYTCQIVSVAQAKSFKNSINYNVTTPWNGQYGGIFALMVSDTCDLSNGYINMENKGGANAYGANGLAFIGNAQDNDILPIGAGHGSVFIMAKKLIINKSTRIGATYDGSMLSGKSSRGNQGGYQGYNGDTGATGGSGAGGGQGQQNNSGGYGSNGGTNDAGTNGGKQGAHVMIIADTISGFNLCSISTGGAAGTTQYSHTGGGRSETSGGAGYGGGVPGNCYAGSGGGYNGGGGGPCNCGDPAAGGGGSSGWAFIYVNHVDTVDNTGVLA